MPRARSAADNVIFGDDILIPTYVKSVISATD